MNKPHLRLLETCKQIREEGEPLFFANNVFELRIRYQDDDTPFTPLELYPARRLIRKLRLIIEMNGNWTREIMFLDWGHILEGLTSLKTVQIAIFISNAEQTDADDWLGSRIFYKSDIMAGTIHRASRAIEKHSQQLKKGLEWAPWKFQEFKRVELKWGPWPELKATAVKDTYAWLEYAYMRYDRVGVGLFISARTLEEIASA